MKRLVWLGALVMVTACGGSGGGDSSEGASDTQASDSSGGDTQADTSADGAADGAADTSEESTDGSEETESSESSADTDMETGTETGGEADPRFLEIQLELENKDGAYGAYPSCTDGANCHSNPDRNVHIATDPTPEQLMQNWQNIVDVADGVTPWVTPLDETAQMLNEVPVPDDVKARWLEWILDGAPFE